MILNRKSKTVLFIFQVESLEWGYEWLHGSSARSSGAVFLVASCDVMSCPLLSSLLLYLLPSHIPCISVVHSVALDSDRVSHLCGCRRPAVVGVGVAIALGSPR